jgi:hypothetical protein
MPPVAEIKKALVAAGIEVYRTEGDLVHIAERVRENLLMDAGISIHAGALKVVFVVTAQRSEFPDDGDERLFERARQQARSAIDRGYREASAEARDVVHPSDARRRLDTFCEVQFEKVASDVDAAVAEARFILGLDKAATR